MKTLFKLLLDLVAVCLKASPSALKYLIANPLRSEIKELGQQVYAYEHIEAAIALSQKMRPTEGGTILDVGGGQATTAAIFSAHFPQHDIWVFEPILSNFQTIERAKERTERWHLVNKAVGSSVGTTEINVANRVTASSLLELDTAQAEGSYGDILQLARIETIQITTLDAEVPADAMVDVLKMDVQGYELEVLRGGLSTLKRTKVVVFEVNNHEGFKNAPTYFEMDEFLRTQGFELYDLYPNLRENGKLMDWDAIYVNGLFK